MSLLVSDYSGGIDSWVRTKIEGSNPFAIAYPWVSPDESRSYSVSRVIRTALDINEDVSKVLEDGRIVNDHRGL